MFIFADNHTKKILMKCVSVLSSTSTGWIPIKWQIVRVGFAASRGTFFNQGRPGFEVNMQYAPRVSTPQSKSFSEIVCVKLVAEVVQVVGSASKFSTRNESKLFPWGLMVELFISAVFFLLQSTLRWGEGQKELGDQEDRDTPERQNSLLYYWAQQKSSSSAKASKFQLSIENILMTDEPPLNCTTGMVWLAFEINENPQLFRVREAVVIRERDGNVKSSPNHVTWSTSPRT
jgi:hypothetical protein